MNRVLRTIRLNTVLAVLVILSVPPPSRAADAAPAEDPGRIIQQFQDTLIEVMKQGKQLGYEGRYRKIAPVVEKTHDLRAIARVAAGQYWTQLSAAQRNELVDAFGKLSIATYAARFDSYSGERFSAPNVRKPSDDRAIVHSDFTKSDGGKVSFTYQLHKTGGKWRIVNIITNGVSDLAMKRAEYTDIIKNSGFKTLIDKLKQKITQYQKEGSG